MVESSNSPSIPAIPNMPLLPPCNSTHIWRPLGRVLDLYVLPTVCLSGLFLNIACIAVFTQRKTVLLYYASTMTNGGGAAEQSRKISTSSLRKFSPVALQSDRRTRINSVGSNIGGNWPRPVEGSGSRETAADEFIAVRTRRAQRRSHPLVPVLIVLCVCDSLQLLFSLLVLYLPALHDHLEMDPLGWMAQIAYLATGSLAGGLLTANCASIWTMCYISIQRHRAIVQPLSTISAGGGSKIVNNAPLLLIAMCALLFNLPIWFEFRWATETIVLDDGTVKHLVWHSRSALAQNETYRFLMRKILYPLCVYLIPLLLISALNIRILTFIHSSSRVQSVGHRRRLAKERRSVWLLISIVLLFFLCHTGGLIIRLVDLRQYGNEPCFVFAKDLVNFLFNINSFANPMLYFFFTKQFRDLRTTWASAQSRSSNIVANAAAAQMLRRERLAMERKTSLLRHNGMIDNLNNNSNEEWKLRAVD